MPSFTTPPAPWPSYLTADGPGPGIRQDIRTSDPAEAYEHLRRHDLRHTGLTWFADAGVQVHVLRKIAGHGSLTTPQRYLHPDVHKITAAGAALSAHLSVFGASPRADGGLLRAPRSLPSPIVVAR
ncbi:site-specific integrase [Streptomyces sp. NPDC058579]|uniref:site-specific integrase n=1 Tax=Streptomyces sp. NPDC058579 TaxID=3346548 RepID=UPI0036689786